MWRVVLSEMRNEAVEQRAIRGFEPSVVGLPWTTARRPSFSDQGCGPVFTDWLRHAAGRQLALARGILPLFPNRIDTPIAATYGNHSVNHSISVYVVVQTLMPIFSSLAHLLGCLSILLFDNTASP